MFWHIDTDIISLLVILILDYYTEKANPREQRTLQSSSFIRCLRTGIILSLIDIASSLVMDYPTSHLLYHILLTAYLLTINLMIVVWTMYALTILYKDDTVNRARFTALIWVLYTIYAALVFSNHWTRLFYSLDPNFEYSRGPLMIPGMIGLFFIYATILLLLIIVRRKHIPADYPKIILVLQPLILGISIPVQLLNPGWLVVFPAYMLCLLLAFLFFQDIRVRSERAQLEQLATTFEHFACGLSISQIDIEENMDIQYISSGFGAICELDPLELRKRLQSDILSGVYHDDQQLIINKISAIAQTRKQHDLTYRYITDSGKQKWVNLHSEAVENADGSATIYSTYTDMTDLKKAEQLIDVALKNTGVSIWEYDFSRRCIIQYQNSTEMHGFERIVPNVPEGLVESGFVHPDSAKAFLEMYNKLFAGAPFAEGVFRVQTSDRQGYWYEHIRYTNSFDETGAPSRAVGMSTNETERQEAIEKYERELEKERGFMMAEGLLAHATFDLTTGETLDYRYHDGSEVEEENRTTFEYAKQKAHLLIDEEERAGFLALNEPDTLLTFFATGDTELQQDYRRCLPDGMATWIRNTLRMLKDPHSGDILLFEYWFDIEDEKMHELMYRSIATDNYDFVAQIDGRTRKFEVMACEGIDYHMPPTKGDDADTVTYNLFDSSVVEEDRAMAIQNSLIENIHAHLNQYKRFVFTYRVKAPDNSLHYKKVTQYYIDEQREIITIMREDITDLIREETDKNRVLSEALEAANQASLAKSQFLSRVSHELRTPLNAIIGFMELSKDADLDQVSTYLANSNTAARQLLSIINDVLDVSAIESGKMTIAHAPFNLHKLISNITELYDPQCRQKGLSYQTRYLTEIDEYLLGDQLRINQILLNLLNNALKFTSRGHVWLSISQQPVRNRKVMVRFEVSDTGCGMSDEMRKRLFQPFEQENAVTAQKYGGSGLGLSIVGSLISMMNGVISVQSRQGEGSSFTIEIPFIKSESELAPELIGKRNELRDTGADVFFGKKAIDTNTLQSEKIDISSMRIMLAEDNAMNRMVAEKIINKRFGVKCEIAEDGEIAFEKFMASAAHYYDVILMDIQMPKMDGYEATMQIRNSLHPDAKSIQIIAVSANAFSEDVIKSQTMGMNAHISKPIDPDILEKALLQAYIQKRAQE